MGKIAVIGDKDSVLAFKAAGADVFNAATSEEARRQIRELKEEYAVILITEQLASGLQDVLERAKTKTYPIIVPVPTANGSMGLGIKGLKKDIEKAIGTDIIFKDK